MILKTNLEEKGRAEAFSDISSMQPQKLVELEEFGYRYWEYYYN